MQAERWCMCTESRYCGFTQRFRLLIDDVSDACSTLIGQYWYATVPYGMEQEAYR